jgi:hypothetical protein
VRTEARIQVPKRDEASDQQCRSDEQYYRKRNFGCHQDRPHLAEAYASCAAVVATLFQHATHIRARCFKSRNQSKQNATQKRDADREPRDAQSRLRLAPPLPMRGMPGLIVKSARMPA